MCAAALARYPGAAVYPARPLDRPLMGVVHHHYSGCSVLVHLDLGVQRCRCCRCAVLPQVHCCDMRALTHCEERCYLAGWVLTRCEERHYLGGWVLTRCVESFHFAGWVLLRCEERLWALALQDGWWLALYSAVELVRLVLPVLLVLLLLPDDLPARSHPGPVGSDCRCLSRVLCDAGARS